MDEASRKETRRLRFQSKILCRRLPHKSSRAYVLALFIIHAGATTALAGAEIGFLVWLGFQATVGLGGKMFERLPWKLYGFNMGIVLIDFVIAGAIIGAWR